MRRLPIGSSVACIGTGPSLTREDIQTARSKGIRLFGCNLIYQIVPDLEVLYGCNFRFWAHYWYEVQEHPAEKWTTNRQAADHYKINWIDEKNRRGLSSNPAYVHHGHGSGYTLLNLAYLMGAERIVLLGYDCKYAPDYDGRSREIGSGKRHYFGEYPTDLQHWPSVHVKSGVHVELVDLYQSVADQGAVEVINCTPGSAITAFPRRGIDEV